MKIGLGHLNRTVEDFWNMTPREFWMLYQSDLEKRFGPKGPPEVITEDETLDLEAEIRRNVARNAK